MSDSETIAAIATGAGCGIGIVRVSGPVALAIGARIFRGRGGRSLETAPPLTLVLGRVVDPATGVPIDEAFAVHMRAGSSYTGEPIVELQCHGGRGVLAAVLRAAVGAGARPAAPGEFTRRAFLSGRIDLSQAEAVAELISASTEGARQAALARLQGGLGEQVRSLRGRLLEQTALVEAILDHGDEDIEAREPDGADVTSLARELQELIAQGGAEQTRSHGPRVVVAGRANSGKSSIFNMLCGRERAIVSATPGTTRDYIEERLSVEGSSVNLVDTAGLRESPDRIEAEGVRRTRRLMTDADLLILTIDASLPCMTDDLNLIEEFRRRSPLIVLTKADLPEAVDRDGLHARCPELPMLVLSTIDGRGCAELARAIGDRCREEYFAGSAMIPNPRHQQALCAAAASLERAAGLLNRHDAPLDQVSIELRFAVASLGEITGETVGEEILDRIFSRFCLGK